MTVARVRQLLILLAVVFTTVGLGAFAWRPSVSRVQVAGASIASPPSAVSFAGSGRGAETIVQSNLFSLSRTVPASRYSPGEPEPDSPDSTMMVTAGDSAATDQTTPKLYGTMISPDGAQALLHLNPADAEPRLYAVGDRGGSYRVVRIDAREVTLSGPRGRVVLRLPDRPDEEQR